jgi:RNA polymerase sigma-70 factor (ECF subfamily)
MIKLPPHAMSEPEPLSVQLATEDLVAEADMLYRFALSRVRDHHLAEDLVQETMLAAVRNPAGFAGRAKLGTWLTGILRNKILDHYRATARNKEDLLSSLNAHANHDGDTDWFNASGHWDSDPNAGLDKLEASPQELLERAEVIAAIQSCLGRLPGGLQRIYTLREFDDCKTDEICASVGITRPSLAVLLHRARQLLRACLQKNWLNP